MSGVTDNLGLILPADGEAYDVDILNANNKTIDAAIKEPIRIETITGSAPGATLSNFIRARGNTKGIIVARIAISMGSTTMPANTASNILLVAGGVPAGYRPKAALGQVPAVIVGTGRGDNVQMTIDIDTGDISGRSSGGTFTALSGSVLYWNIVYEWSGVL